jgi:hypothetical protein
MVHYLNNTEVRIPRYTNTPWLLLIIKAFLTFVISTTSALVLLCYRLGLDKGYHMRLLERISIIVKTLQVS